MNNSTLSIDSLGPELDMLRQSVKQKERDIADKELIIKSLRQREQDMNQAIEELENNEQLKTRDIDRLTKELAEKDADLEAISHALKEVETAYDTLNKRFVAKSSQLQQFYDSLAKSSKDLEEMREINKQLQHKNDLLTNQVSDMNFQMKKSQRDYEQQIEQLKKTTNTTSGQDGRNVMRLAKEMRFTIAHEMEEDIMESRSTIQATQHIKPPKPSVENIPPPACVHRQKPEPPIHDPIAEYKMRMARANELARRNQQTKALHQTSYPLELDTFGDTLINEQDIKRGNIVSMPQRAPPPVPSQYNSHQQNNNTPTRQSTRHRKALANQTNTPPVARKVYKKAEAFIV